MPSGQRQIGEKQLSCDFSEVEIEKLDFPPASTPGVQNPKGEKAGETHPVPKKVDPEQSLEERAGNTTRGRPVSALDQARLICQAGPSMAAIRATDRQRS